MQERPSLVMESKSCKRGVKVVVSVKSCLHVLGGGPDGARVSLPAQSHRPHLRLHLRGAAGHPPGADLQVDSCAGELSGRSGRVKITDCRSNWSEAP